MDKKTYHVVVTTTLTKEYDVTGVSKEELEAIIAEDYCDIDDDDVILNTRITYKERKK